MPNNSIIIQNWYPGTTYMTYDVTAGINISNVSYYGPPYWSTIDDNIGNNPSGQFVYAVSAFSRDQDIASVNVTFTGITPNFARGSLYAFVGIPENNINATGMILNASPNGPSGVTLQFINPGPYIPFSATALGVLNCPEPSWTTGFFWTPTYGSQWGTDQAVIKAQFEAGYSQRQPQGLFVNITNWSLAFNDRTDREAKGLIAFVQNLGAVNSTPILMPPNRLFNNPYLKYVLSSPRVNTKTYNQNDITVSASQVADY